MTPNPSPTNTTTLAPPVQLPAEHVRPTRSFWQRLRRTRLGVFALGVILLIVACAVAAPILSPYDPYTNRLIEAFGPPTAAHPFGLDDLGRDILTRVLYGARVSLQASLISVSLAFLVGVTIGVTAGYWGGWVDLVLMRLIDALLAFPALVLALAITASLGPGLGNAMIAIAIVGIPVFARLARAQVLTIRRWEFVEAAHALGATDLRILSRHIFLNITTPLIVQVSLSAAFAILAEASLSFLGLGVQPPTPSWGSMLNVGKNYLDLAPWLSLFPGGAIFLSVIAFNTLGDAIRDALDPFASSRQGAS